MNIQEARYKARGWRGQCERIKESRDAGNEGLADHLQREAQIIWDDLRRHGFEVENVKMGEDVFESFGELCSALFHHDCYPRDFSQEVDLREDTMYTDHDAGIPHKISMSVTCNVCGSKFSLPDTEEPHWALGHSLYYIRKEGHLAIFAPGVIAPCAPYRTKPEPENVICLYCHDHGLDHEVEFKKARGQL